MDYVGILTDENYELADGKNFSFMHVYMLKRAKELGVNFAILSPEGICEKRSYVEGKIIKDDKLILQKLPFPKVVHERGIGHHKIMEDCRKSLLAQNAVFSTSRSNIDNMEFKDNLATFLAENKLPHAKTYLNNEKNLQQLLSLRKPFVAKPREGWGGIGVSFFFPWGEHSWKVKEGGNEKDLTEREVFSVINDLEARCNEGYLGYIILQEYVDFLRWKNCVFDIRVHYQKKDLTYVQSDKYVRVGAGPESLVTNINKGSSLNYSLEEVTKNLPSSLFEEIEILGQKIARELEFKNGLLSEFGLDIGVLPESFRPLIIEVNSKPGYRHPTEEEFYQNPVDPFCERIFQRIPEAKMSRFDNIIHHCKGLLNA